MNVHRSPLITVAVTMASLFLSAHARAQTGTINLKETRVYYEATGRGPAVVFIHGFALNLREWDDQVKALSASYRVVTYDRRGFGKSTGFADGSADPGDLKELLDSLGVRSAVLVGHSAGAGVGLRFAVTYGDRVAGLVLYPGGAPAGFPIPASQPHPMAPMRDIARTYGLDSAWKFVASLPMFWNPPNRPDIEARIQAMLAAYSGRDLLEDHTPSGRYPPATFEQMKQMRIPTLFIAGEREWPRALLVADSMARWMPNARRVVIPGGGHGGHLAQAEKFNETLVTFLRGLTPGAKR